MSLALGILGFVLAGLAGLATILLATSRRSASRRMQAVVTRLETGWGPPMLESKGQQSCLNRLERVAGTAKASVTEAEERTTRLGRALDALEVGVVVCDQDGEVVYRNRAMDSIVGNRRTDAVAIKAVQEMLAESAVTAPLTRALDLYGPPRRTLIVHTSVVDDGRRAIGAIAVLEDVTERKRLEAVRRDFVANVSHELKTPIGALGLLAETLAAEDDPGVSRRLAERIHNEAFRVSRMIEDLLDLSHIEAEESPIREVISLNLVLAEAVDSVRGLAASAGVTVEVTEAIGADLVLGDRRQLTSAVNNLCENAIKYSESGSTVHARASTAESWALIEVTDHGIGIPSRDLERIFERFYRVEAARSRKSGGTGLGLAIVRHVAGIHMGRVEVASREGEGSTFTLRIPLAPGPVT
ncbi:MAG: sensor histidine kinase [Acidimicrobiales bacterium]